jgi:hypothetical protein
MLIAYPVRPTIVAAIGTVAAPCRLWLTLRIGGLEGGRDGGREGGGWRERGV